MTETTSNSYADIKQTQLVGYILIILGLFTTLVFSVGLDGEANTRHPTP